jgi:type IV pilus assembly protein PilB
MQHIRLGDLLIQAGSITEEQLEQALALQKEKRLRLGELLITENIITEKELIEAIEMQLGIEFIDLSHTDVAPEMAAVLSKNIARKHNVLPVRQSHDILYLAMEDPLNFVAMEEVKAATRLKVIPMIATKAAVERAIEALYGNVGAAMAIEEMKREVGDEEAYQGFATNVIEKDATAAPTIRLVNSIMERAVIERASDIHIEPREEELIVRMRIDGQMRNILTVPKNLQNAVISRVKVMSNIDISERKIPQDGRTNIRVKGTEIDLRVSTLPVIYGEKIVIRLLRKDGGLLNKKAIGLHGEDLEKYDRLLRSVSGVLLIAGPTGSGKTSTMYTMIGELNKENVNLVTLEDPVEYNLAGCNQVQINEKVGMTFASGLRAILRQDPDIIAVGEIRDGETATIALQSAITGHIVLSTIHTNDALSTIDRLKDIGVEDYMISTALRGVISQRLVRKLCPQCKEEHVPDPADAMALGFDPAEDLRFYRGKGCPMCAGTGYVGRVGVFEILVIDQALRTALSRNADREELLSIMERGGFVPMLESCRRLVQNGTTSLEEALRTITTTDA